MAASSDAVASDSKQRCDLTATCGVFFPLASRGTHCLDGEEDWKLSRFLETVSWLLDASVETTLSDAIVLKTGDSVKPKMF